MPTFDFNCQQCHQHFEAIIPFGARKFPTCPACGNTKVEKLLSMPGIAFKGSGFYKNDAAPLPEGEGKKKDEKKDVKKEAPKEKTPKNEVGAL